MSLVGWGGWGGLQGTALTLTLTLTLILTLTSHAALDGHHGHGALKGRDCSEQVGERVEPPEEGAEDRVRTLEGEVRSTVAEILMERRRPSGAAAATTAVTKVRGASRLREGTKWPFVFVCHPPAVRAAPIRSKRIDASKRAVAAARATAVGARLRRLLGP